jgi:hypothetical protein
MSHRTIAYQRRSASEQVVQLQAQLAQKDVELQAGVSQLSQKDSTIAQLQAKMRAVQAARQPELEKSKAAMQAQVALTRTTEQRLASMEQVLSERKAALAAKSEEVRLLALSQPVEHRDKWARSDLHSSSSSSSSSALDRDDICDMVLGYVGTGEHLYMGSISRRYRGRYMQLCSAADKQQPRVPGRKALLATSCAAAMQSAARLQLAFDAGLSDLEFAETQPFGDYIYWLTSACADPIAALAIARIYGVPWTADITTNAAAAGKLELLQWCVKSRCPLNAEAALTAAAEQGDVPTVQWLLQQLVDLVDCRVLYHDMLVSVLYTFALPLYNHSSNVLHSAHTAASQP